jgi:hypothetical protein
LLLAFALDRSLSLLNPVTLLNLSSKIVDGARSGKRLRSKVYGEKAARNCDWSRDWWTDGGCVVGSSRL